MRVYYFGCWDGIGHFLWTPNANSVPLSAVPWGKAVDTGLCPGRRNRFGDVEPSEQREGWAALHHREDWTALAFWDRSVDQRHGSNSAFIAEGVLDVAEMLEASAKAFPGVMARLTYQVTI